jgi:hypothetical protein
MPPFDVSSVFFPNRDPVAELPPGPEYLQYRHRTVSGVSAERDNIEFPWYWTRLSHPALDGHPEAIATVTPVGRVVIDEQDHTATLIQNNRAVGLVYNEAVHRWYIYNLDLSAMAVGADFNVAINEEAINP